MPISRGNPTFLIWFASLDRSTLDLYDRNGGRLAFNDRDSRDMEGDVFTPHVLADRVLELEKKIDWRHQIWPVLVGSLVGAVLGVLMTLGLQALLDRSEPPTLSGDSEPATSSVDLRA